MACRYSRWTPTLVVLTTVPAAQVIQEAPGGGDRVAGPADDVGGGAYHGSGRARHDGRRVGERVTRRFHDADAGRDIHAELPGWDRLVADTAQLVPRRRPVARERDQPEQASEFGVNDRVGREGRQRCRLPAVAVRGHAELVCATAAVTY